MVAYWQSNVDQVIAYIVRLHKVYLSSKVVWKVHDHKKEQDRTEENIKEPKNIKFNYKHHPQWWGRTDDT